MNVNFQRILAAALLLVSASFEAGAEGLRIRGEITGIEGHRVTVLNSSGQTLAVSVPEPVVLLYRNIALDEIKDGAYISVPSVAVGDNERRALGVNQFPDAMRGVNEGFSAWDLTVESKMTNATVAQVVSRGGERVLTVTYGEEEQTIVVPENVPVTRFGPAPDRKLAVGQMVVIFAHEDAGKLTGKFVGLHENGGLPPI